MYVASDFNNGYYRITALFTGPDSKAKAVRWAGQNGKVTRIVKREIFLTLRTGKALPKRYIH
jgi:hypothetical protein